MSGWEPGREWPPYPSGTPSPSGPAWPDWRPVPPPPPPPRHRTLLPVLVILAAVAVMVIAATGAGLVVWSSMRYVATGQRGFTGQNASDGGTGAGSLDGTQVAAIAAKVDPAVVIIDSTFDYQQASGAGTGIVLTSDGEVLTNNHVINGATRIRVTDVGNGRTYSGTVIGYDNSHDVAVLRLHGASGLRTASLGDSTRLAVGQPVVAIGNAGGTGGTPTSAAGSITALDQSITASNDLNGTAEQLSGLVQVDANVQPGDSGGPLVDSAGRVIGVDTAASAGMTFQGASGQGYAIPISAAIRTVRQIESGRSSSTVHVGSTAFLGVLLGSASGGQDGGGFGGAGGGPAGSGAPVRGVVGGSAADRAGITAGALITSLNGRTVDSAATLGTLMAGRRPGERVTIGWVDSTGSPQSATVALGAGPPA